MVEKYLILQILRTLQIIQNPQKLCLILVFAGKLVFKPKPFLKVTNYSLLGL